MKIWKKKIKLAGLFTLIFFVLQLVPLPLHYRSSAQLESQVWGKVIDKETGEPVAQALVVAVKVENEEPADWIGYEKTSSDGVYMIDRVSSGDYWVFCCPPEGSNYALDLTPKKVKVGPTTWKLIDNQPYVEADFELEIGGSISGTVLEKESGNPLVKVGIIAVSVNETTMSVDENAKGIGITNENGEYKITHLKENNYYIIVLPKGNAIAYNDNIIVNKGGTTSNINLSVDVSPKSSIKGIVKDVSTNIPIKDAFIGVIGAESGGWDQSPVQGTYQIKSLPAGRYTIVVKASGFETQVKEEVEVGPGEEKTIEFALNPIPIETSQHFHKSIYNRLSRFGQGNFLNNLAVAATKEEECKEFCELFTTFVCEILDWKKCCGGGAGLGFKVGKIWGAAIGCVVFAIGCWKLCEPVVKKVCMSECRCWKEAGGAEE